MSIIKYEIINPITNTKKPHVNKYGVFIIPNIKHNYRYYIEVMRYNDSKYCYEYFLLLSDTKFDEQCRKCNVDNYGRLKVIIHKELKYFINEEMNNRGNLNVEYIESEELYDVWQIF